MRDCAAANTYFVSNVLFLPALYVKLDDLHVNWLEGLQGNVKGCGGLSDCEEFSGSYSQEMMGLVVEESPRGV